MWTDVFASMGLLLGHDTKIWGLDTPGLVAAHRSANVTMMYLTCSTLTVYSMTLMRSGQVELGPLPKVRGGSERQRR